MIIIIYIVGILLYTPPTNTRKPFCCDNPQIELKGKKEVDVITKYYFCKNCNRVVKGHKFVYTWYGMKLYYDYDMYEIPKYPKQTVEFEKPICKRIEDSNENITPAPKIKNIYS